MRRFPLWERWRTGRTPAFRFSAGTAERQGVRGSTKAAQPFLSTIFRRGCREPRRGACGRFGCRSPLCDPRLWKARFSCALSSGQRHGSAFFYIRFFVGTGVTRSALSAEGRGTAPFHERASGRGCRSPGRTVAHFVVSPHRGDAFPRAGMRRGVLPPAFRRQGRNLTSGGRSRTGRPDVSKVRPMPDRRSQSLFSPLRTAGRPPSSDADIPRCGPGRRRAARRSCVRQDRPPAADSPPAPA